MQIYCLKKKVHTSSLFKNILIVLSIILLILLLSLGLSTPKNTKNYTYKPVQVKNGDTIWSLVKQSELDMNINILVQKTISYNNLYNSWIQPGQIIYIPCRISNS